ncbi:MAG: ATP-binding protein [Janthinobacterium lividum]
MTPLLTLPAPFSRRIAARREDVAALGDAFAAWAGQAALPRRTIFHVELILDELLTNIVMHGVRSAMPGPDAPVMIDLCVAFTATGAALSIAMRDNARPFDLTGHAPADTLAPLAARPEGGLGLHFVRQLTQAAHYHRANGCNHLVLRKDIIPDA